MPIIELILNPVINESINLVSVGFYMLILTLIITILIEKRS